MEPTAVSALPFVNEPCSPECPLGCDGLHFQWKWTSTAPSLDSSWGSTRQQSLETSQRASQQSDDLLEPQQVLRGSRSRDQQSLETSRRTSQQSGDHLRPLSEAAGPPFQRTTSQQSGGLLGPLSEAAGPGTSAGITGDEDLNAWMAQHCSQLVTDVPVNGRPLPGDRLTDARTPIFNDSRLLPGVGCADALMTSDIGGNPLQGGVQWTEAVLLNELLLIGQGIGSATVADEQAPEIHGDFAPTQNQSCSAAVMAPVQARSRAAPLLLEAAQRARTEPRQGHALRNEVHPSLYQAGARPALRGTLNAHPAAGGSLYELIVSGGFKPKGSSAWWSADYLKAEAAPAIVGEAPLPEGPGIDMAGASPVAMAPAVRPSYEVDRLDRTSPSSSAGTGDLAAGASIDSAASCDDGAGVGMTSSESTTAAGSSEGMGLRVSAPAAGLSRAMPVGPAAVVSPPLSPAVVTSLGASQEMECSAEDLDAAPVASPADGRLDVHRPIHRRSATEKLRRHRVSAGIKRLERAIPSSWMRHKYPATLGVRADMVSLLHAAADFIEELEDKTGQLFRACHSQDVTVGY